MLSHEFPSLPTTTTAAAAPPAFSAAVSVADLIATEYALVSVLAELADPGGEVADTPFGRVIRTPAFADRYDANQMLDVRFPAPIVPNTADPGTAEAVEALLGRMDVAFGELPYRKLCGHDAKTWTHLAPALAAHGFAISPVHIMRWQDAPTRPINSAVQIEAIPTAALMPDESAAATACLQVMGEAVGRSPGGQAFVVAASRHVVGEHLVGYLDGRPAGVTGWFCVDGVARFFPVETAEWARGRGVASTLIQRVQSTPAVRQARALALLCAADGGPVTLYQALGFVPVAPFWEAHRLPPPQE